jgi:GcrA cell cycle regulator
MRRLRLEEMRELACRWPLGDPASGDFAYCGLTPAKGRSYCAGHCRLAYRPPTGLARRDAHGPRRRVANSWRAA